jgi:hypothetical protein
MKIFKRILITLAILIVLALAGGYFYIKSQMKAPPNELVVANGTVTIPFAWDSATINNVHYDKAALLLPVNLLGCDKKFYMQFDMGASFSMFYMSKLKMIHEQFRNIPFTKQSKDTSKLDLLNYDFSVGNLAVKAKDIKLSNFSSDSIAWSDTSRKVVIGTLGPDFIEGKILTIDYPNQTITVSSELSANDTDGWFDLRYEERRVMLPVAIDSEEYYLYFDTGSSTYQMITKEAIFKKHAAKDAPVESYNLGGSWDNTYQMQDVKTNKQIDIAGRKLPLVRLSNIPGDFKIKLLFWALDVEGMTGNSLFLNNKLVIDTKNKRFKLL